MERFYKMTGSGNDFVMLDGREHELADWPAERIAAVCARQTGVGADGLVLLTPEGAGRVGMRYFNADGSFAAMCGNAALCSTRLAARLGLAPGEGMTLLTPAGEVESRCVGSGNEAEINLPAVAPLVRVEGVCRAGEHQAWLGTGGGAAPDRPGGRRRAAGRGGPGPATSVRTGPGTGGRQRQLHQPANGTGKALADPDL